MEIEVRNGEINEAITISNQIPEFQDPYDREDYLLRLRGDFLILVALVNKEPAGFKVGYDKFNSDSVFYSWFGGVRPEFRNIGLGSALQVQFERWCLDMNYSRIRFKTLNKHRNMIVFGIKHGFSIYDFKRDQNSDLSKIYFEKVL